MKKPNLFFDFDDTIFRSWPLVVSYLNGKYNLNLKEGDFNGVTSFEDVITKHREALNLTYDEFYLDYAINFLSSMAWHEKIELMEGAKEIIPLLAKKYNLYIVTARQKISMDVINHLISKNFPDCFKEIHCIWEYVEGIGYVQVSKKDFILGVSGEKIAFIDDSPKEVFKMEGVIPTYIFDPYGTKGEIGFPSFKNWYEIGDKFLKE